MEYAPWEDGKAIPLPTDDFDQYFAGYNEVDDLFNETLAGLLGLDVPSGFVQQQQQQDLAAADSPYTRKHGRKISGTAIFGYTDHGKSLSIHGMDAAASHTNDLAYRESSSGRKTPAEPGSVSPGQLLKLAPQHPLEHDEEDSRDAAATPGDDDFIVTNESPKAYKFPSTAAPPLLNHYDARYLQEFSDTKREYADDIEPLLGDELADAAQLSPFGRGAAAPAAAPQPHYKFVPIPVHHPRAVTLATQRSAYLPPPSPSPQSNEDWLSPEPPSPSPARAGTRAAAFDEDGYPAAPFSNNPNFSSPLHPQMAKHAYLPQFFSDNNPSGYAEQGGNNLAYARPTYLSPHAPQPFQSSPPYGAPVVLPHTQTLQLDSSPLAAAHAGAGAGAGAALLNLSPVRGSPLRNVASHDDSLVDANATIVQLTPLKEGQFTPRANRVDLKWSPVILPSAKRSKDVRRAIQEFTPKRKLEKTLLLPPGQLDQYWEGPDENKVFTCVFNGCGKVFTRRYNVRLHIQTHLSDRPFGCPYCPKKFVRQHDLNRHVKGHQEARYCRCPCGKEFARHDAMRKHRARNICVGGVASSENHCVVKPRRRALQLLMDGLTSDLLSDDIAAMGR